MGGAFLSRICGYFIFIGFRYIDILKFFIFFLIFSSHSYFIFLCVCFTYFSTHFISYFFFGDCLLLSSMSSQYITRYKELC